jgi:hypothetical protein
MKGSHLQLVLYFYWIILLFSRYTKRLLNIPKEVLVSQIYNGKEDRGERELVTRDVLGDYVKKS